VVNYNQTLILHGYGDLKTEVFWGHDLDLLGSRNVIGHVTIGLAIRGFLVRVPCTVMEIWSLIFWGHDLDLLGSSDVIGHMTIGHATYELL